ncbi:MAG TPA: ATP-binding cassette domain-containing protein [Acidimicrobiales bacterium]|nr:ATP-binding cassette domain-containing protein [Acidimicrobiales bacterium]
MGTSPAPIEVRGLTKRFGSVLAVDGVDFAVHPGTVTGFLGPNGAGKTTTLRMLVGLVRPTAGQALVRGVPYRELADPLRTVGAVLEASGFHPARTARQHLRSVARVAGISDARAEEVLGIVGLADSATRRVGGYSLGMRQRLQLAQALLGDPEILILDEPANGLDPQGIAWIRGFLRWYASLGRVVLVSSHLLAEASQTVDDLIVLAAGRVVGRGPLQELLAGARGSVRVRTPDAERLLAVLAAGGIAAHQAAAGVVVADATSPEKVGPLMAEHRIVVYEMSSSGDSLEELFFSLTEGAGMGGFSDVATGPHGRTETAT